MRKMSKAAKAEAYDALKREREVYAELAWLTFNEHKPDAVESFIRDDSEYEFRLYGATRAHGGIVVCVFRHPGQTNGIDAIYFDDWILYTNSLPYGCGNSTEIKIATERLRVERNALYTKTQ